MRKKGISLIVLVITILVLSILATAAVMSLKDSDIIKRAQNAVDETKNSVSKEEQMIKYVEGLIASGKEVWSGTQAVKFNNGNGTKENPFIISNGEELAYFASEVNSGNSFSGKYVELSTSINLGNSKFTPIGLGAPNITREVVNWPEEFQNKFNGTFNGNDNAIAGLNIEELQYSGVGLFGVLGENGVIENLNIYSGSVTGDHLVGGIVGASKGKVINCSNRANVIAKDDANRAASGEVTGGIIGLVSGGNIENCINYGQVISKNDVSMVGHGKVAGGIIGEAIESGATIKNCINNGKVVTMYQQAGGIVGAAASTLVIDNCTNTGSIVDECTEEFILVKPNAAGIYIGGIVGWQSGQNDTITNCTNTGNIKAYATASGISARMDNGIISNCVNKGNIETTKQITGGIVGLLNLGIVQNCENIGVLNSTSAVGGVVGYIANGSVDNCSNKAKVSASSHVSGGIIATMAGGSITNCNNVGEVVATLQQVGGIVASIKGGIVQNVYNGGYIHITSDSQKGMLGGIVGAQTGGNVSNIYNNGKVEITNQNNKVIVIGGIAGYIQSGSISRAYNNGDVLGQNGAIGLLVGQKSTTALLEKMYYYSDSALKAVGSEADKLAQVVAIEDLTGKYEKTQDNITNYNSFLTWINSK